MSGQVVFDPVTPLTTHHAPLTTSMCLRRWLVCTLLAALLSQAAALRAQQAGEYVPPPAETHPWPHGALVPPPPFAQALEAPPGDFSAPTALEMHKEVADAPAECEPKSIWSGRIVLGFDGSEGNSTQYTARATAKAKRKTPEDEFSLEYRYFISSGEVERTQDNWLLDWRFEDFVPDSPWSFFIHGTVEYDAFRAFDYRVTVDSGLAYNLIKNATTDFQLRAGGGFSREYGIPDAEYIPEASYGCNFEHRFTKRQKVVAKGDLFPDVRDFSDYRATGEAAWEILVDEAEHLSLRFSVIDRYDSTPGEDKKHNDVTYSAELAWDF